MSFVFPAGDVSFIVIHAVFVFESEGKSGKVYRVVEGEFSVGKDRAVSCIAFAVG